MNNLSLKHNKLLRPQNPHPEDSGEYDNPWGGDYHSRPIITRTKVFDYSNGQGKPMEVAEDREYTRAELQKVRTHFCQKHLSDVDWLLHAWSSVIVQISSSILDR